MSSTDLTIMGRLWTTPNIGDPKGYLEGALKHHFLPKQILDGVLSGEDDPDSARDHACHLPENAGFGTINSNPELGGQIGAPDAALKNPLNTELQQAVRSSQPGLPITPANNHTDAIGGAGASGNGPPGGTVGGVAGVGSGGNGGLHRRHANGHQRRRSPVQETEIGTTFRTAKRRAVLDEVQPCRLNRCDAGGFIGAKAPQTCPVPDARRN